MWEQEKDLRVVKAPALVMGSGGVAEEGLGVQQVGLF